MKTTDLTLYGSNASLSTTSPLPTAVEHASVAGYEYTAPQQVNAFTSGYENILDMGFLSGMDSFPDMGSLFGSDAPIPGAGSQWASNHSDEYGEVIDEPAATGTGSTETTGSGQGGETAANTTDDVEHSEENTATDNADSTDNGDTHGNEDEYMQPGTDDTAEENEETADNRQRVPTADEIKALLSRIEQGTVTAGDVADRFETDENGNEWAVINGQRVSPDAVITGAAVPVDSNGQPAGQPVYEMVMAESITEPSSAELSALFGSNYDGNVSNNDASTFKDIYPQWQFGDGSVNANPEAAENVRKFLNTFGINLTNVDLENIVHSIANAAQNDPAQLYNYSYQKLCETMALTYCMNNGEWGGAYPGQTPETPAPTQGPTQPSNGTPPTTPANNNNGNNSSQSQNNISNIPFLGDVANGLSTVVNFLTSFPIPIPPQGSSSSTSAEQKKIVDNLKDIREAGKITIEKGSIQNTNGNTPAGSSIKNNGRFAGTKSPSYPIIMERLKGINGFSKLPYYLQQEIANNISDYVIYLMCTTSGSTELKAWLDSKGKNHQNFSNEAYNEQARVYVIEKMKSMVQDVVSKATSENRENLDALISGNAGQGLIDLRNLQAFINSQGVFSPYSHDISGQEFGYREYTNNGRLVQEMHIGLDTSDGNQTGRMIQAPIDGVITTRGAIDGYGNRVVITNPNNLQLHIGHMANIADIREGQIVAQGLTTLGEMGHTDNAQGLPNPKMGIHQHSTLDYTLIGEGKNAIHLNQLSFSDELQKFKDNGGNLEGFMKSQKFYDYLNKTLRVQLETSLATHGNIEGVANYCRGQINLINNAVKKLKATYSYLRD